MSDKPNLQPDAEAREWLDSCSRRALAGDAGALSELHARLTPGLIRHFKRRLTSGWGSAGSAGTGGAAGSTIDAAREDLAEELSQLTWITFWKALESGKYDPAKARLSTFLYAVAGNIWLRHRRSAGRPKHTQGLEEIEDLAQVDVQESSEQANFAASLDLLRSMMLGDEPRAGLTADDRAVLRSIAAGRSDRDLASELGVAPSTAHARKRSAIEKVREYLAGKGFASHPSEG